MSISTNLNGVTQLGSWSFTLGAAIPTGANTIGAVNQAGAWSVAVSNFPATQPVSGTFWQATQPVSGTFWQATQPVSGTVTANAGTNLNTSALLLDATFTGRINTLGQKAMAASTPVVVASDQSAVPVSGTFWQATQPVSGAFWQATQPVSGTFWQTTQPVSATALPLPANAALETGGNLAALVAVLPPSGFFPPPSAFFGAP